MNQMYSKIIQEVDALIGKKSPAVFFSEEENQLLLAYTDSVVKQYGLGGCKTFEKEENETVSIENSQTVKKKVVLKTPFRESLLRIKTEETEHKKSGQKEGSSCSSLKTFSKCSPNKNLTPLASHGRTHSAYMLSINGKKQISLEKTGCSTHKVINFRSIEKQNSQGEEQSGVKVAEFNLGDSESKSTCFKKKDKNFPISFRMCFGCQEYIPEDCISEHEQECQKISGLYQLSSQDLLSETESKLSTKKSYILSKFQHKNKENIEDLYQNIRKYLQNDEEESFTYEKIQKESVQVLECLQQFHKLQKYRRIKSALAHFSQNQ